MQKSDLPRHQIIKSLTAQPSYKVADAAIDLWAQMATQLILIVGEGGFNSLYTRSIFLTQRTYPWLAANTQSPQTGHRFNDLRMNFEGKTPALVSEANNLLLVTFTDILASLIGEQLTTRILNSAWGDNAPDRVTKEFKNE